METRLYAATEFKFAGEDPATGEITLRGTATTPGTDRMGDVVEPKGAVFKLPLPLFFMHSSAMPIGLVRSVEVTKSGIEFVATVAKQGVDQVIDRARNLLREGLLRAVSIGFRSIESEPVNPKEPFGGQRFLKWEWLELSVVPIPANEQATISSIKAYDERSRGAQAGAKASASAAGAASTSTKGRAMNLKEQIASFEATRAAKQAQMDSMMAKAAEDGVTLSDEQSTEYDQLAADVVKIDAHLKRLYDMEKRNGSAATTVVATEDKGERQTKPIVRAGEGVLRPNDNLPKGMGFARYVKALAFAKGNASLALEYAERQTEWQNTPDVIDGLKAAVGAGTTTDSAWAGPLVYNQNLASEFVELLRPKTIIGRIDGFRRVPFNIRFPVQSGGSTVGWVGQGLGKPVSKLQVTSSSLGFAKAAGIVVITQELARFSSPSAEMMVRNDLVAQMTQFLDAQFIDPGVAAVANVNPASVTNGASNVRQAAAAWTSEANVITDVKAFLAVFAANEIDLGPSTYWIMDANTALCVGMLKTGGGENFAFPGLNVNGGTFFGIPVIVSNGVPHSVSAGAVVALVTADNVFLADEGGVAVDASEQASLQMDSAPTQDSGTPTASTMVSMWQTNSIAIRCERIINWARRRTYGVGYIDNVHTS